MHFLEGFDASKVQPKQGFDAHPVGLFDAQITHTYLKPSEDNTCLMFNVEFTTAVGKIEKRYIVDHKNPQVVAIAEGQISALCHACSVYRVTNPKNPDGSPIFDRAGAELRNARCKIEVAPQTRKNSQTNQFEETGYMEVKKVFDPKGNEPGKTGSAPQPQQQPQPGAPMQQNQPGGNWAQPNQNPTGAPSNAQPAPGPAPGQTPAWGQPAQNGNPQPQWQQGGQPNQPSAPWTGGNRS